MQATSSMAHTAVVLLLLLALAASATATRHGAWHWWVDPKSHKANATNVLVCRTDLKKDTTRHKVPDDPSRTASWYHMWRGNAYVLVDQDVPGNFADCLASCAFKTAPGFTMLTIASKEENNLVATLTSNTHLYNCTTGLGRSTWLGITDVLEEGRLTYFVNGSDIGYQQWASLQPNDDGGQDCIRTIKSGTLNGDWEDIQCDRVWAIQQLCMCKHDGGQTEQDAVYLGDSGYGSHFWGLRTKRSWEGCRVGCYKEVPGSTGRMTMPKTKQHWRALQSVAYDHADSINMTHVWVGATDMVDEGTWIWADKSPVTFAPWADTQPDNRLYLGQGQDEDCALMSINDWTYADEYCGIMGACVCEGPAP